MKEILQKWTDLLNTYFDFGSYGEKPLSKKSALAILLLTAIVSVLLLTYLAASPEQLPGT